jgi:hypothetical protein
MFHMEQKIYLVHQNKKSAIFLLENKFRIRIKLCELFCCKIEFDLKRRKNEYRKFKIEIEN